MRLIITILWCVATVCWLPWFALLVRLLVDLGSGRSWDQTYFTVPALIGIWPKYGWLDWRIVSLWPLAALAGMALSAIGWRLYWREQDGLLTRPAWLVTCSIVVPPLAPLVMLADARRRHLARNAALEEAVSDARERLGAAKTD